MKKILGIHFTYFICHFIAAQSPIISTQYNKEVISSAPLSGNYVFLEGPLWTDDNNLLFTDIVASKIYLWSPKTNSVSLFLDNTNGANGLTFDSQNKLVACNQSGRAITRIENGTKTIIATHYDGKKLNSPNDLVLRKKTGTLFFTDPPYGLNGATSELGYQGIYSLSTTGAVNLLDKTLVKPNGIALSLDENTLYVSDTETNKIYKFNIVNDNTLSNKIEIASFTAISGKGNVDGMTIDKNGFLYCSSPRGITILSPTYNIEAHIDFTEKVTNCEMGGINRDQLFVTTGSGKKVYKISNKVSVGLTNENLDTATFKIYPNPIQKGKELNIELTNDNTLTIKFFTSNGTLLSEIPQKSYTKGVQKISLSSLLTYEVAGIYIIEITDDKNNVFSQKINVIE